MHLLETLTECGWYSYSGCIKELSFDSMETGQFSPLPGLRYQSSYAYAKLLNMILRGLLMESDELESFRYDEFRSHPCLPLLLTSPQMERPD